MSRHRTPISELLPPLICGTATFNSQYNLDPYALPTTNIVHRALSLGVRAFDTSPYYGPAEELLGEALDTSFVRESFNRSDYFLLTKVGRVSGDVFNYSADWVRCSIQNSLARLRTKYLDVVYCHDVEFVSAEEVLIAVKELRRIRDESGIIKYVGISGYPVDILCELAEMIVEKTGEPLDAVMSYANFTLQNTKLGSVGLSRLRAAGVDVVPNASALGMGLLRRVGVPIGGQGDFHPSPTGLRKAIQEASDWCDVQGDRIEKVAVRFTLENWLREGDLAGSKGDPASGIPWIKESTNEIDRPRIGVSVIGVSTVNELDETMRVWKSILDGLNDGEQTAMRSGRGVKDRLWSLSRQQEVQTLADGIRKILDTWVDYTWDSPPVGYAKRKPVPVQIPAPLPTPIPSPDQSVLDYIKEIIEEDSRDESKPA